MTRAAFFILSAITTLCFALPLFENMLGFDGNAADLGQRFLPPSPQHFLGTDDIGRDIFLRLLEGGRLSLSAGFLTAAIATLIGTGIGLAAGYAGGRTDMLLMRLTDTLIALPALPLLIVLSAIDGAKIGLASGDAGFLKIVVIIAFLGWTTTARLVRARVLTIKNLDFIRAARAVGMGNARIVFRHILPNVMDTVIVAATLSVGHVILMESVLSFLGLGIQPPAASWGNMLSNAEETMWGNPALSVWPGMMIFLTVLSVNFIGDHLQDKANPRKKA